MCSSATSSPASPPRTPRAPPPSSRAGAHSGARPPSLLSTATCSRTAARPGSSPSALPIPAPSPTRCPASSRRTPAPSAASTSPSHPDHNGGAPRRDGALARRPRRQGSPRTRLCQPPLAARPAPPGHALQLLLPHPPLSRRLEDPGHRRRTTRRQIPQPQGARGLCMTVMEDRDLAFMLERSPVLESRIIMGSQTGVRLRLVSQSVRCVQLGYTYLEDIEVVDAPRLERLFQSDNFRQSGLTAPSIKNCSSKIKIGRAPNLRVLGYIRPGEQELGISNTIIVAGTKESIVPSVQILAIDVQFGCRNSVKKVPGFLRCFPNLGTLHVQSARIPKESTGKVNLKFWQECGPIKCVLQSLKKVFLYKFRGSRSEVAFLKFIAERGRVLEQMVVVVAKECFSPGSDGLNAKLKPLTNAKWNSKACKLELFKSPLTDVAGPICSHRHASDFGFADPFDLEFYCESETISVS
ncbi:unnamed protein product [Triticum turgidum subsp. durum]|uniref:FBD domain-containing protein n=1 Tax=Triticum turgidum subsp. durum TaxID=4567 RepID=A0A9R0RZ58_TRITD|nr:unnamed protein product [Triticum turgidum subsp. durum]